MVGSINEVMLCVSYVNVVDLFLIVFFLFMFLVFVEIVVVYRKVVFIGWIENGIFFEEEKVRLNFFYFSGVINFYLLLF